MTRCGSTCDGAALPWVGYIGAALAVIFFGSNFIPVKKFDTGDGLFFQWVMCVGIWLVGVVINVVQLQPPFFVPALLGGFLWTTGEEAARVITLQSILRVTSPLRQHCRCSHHQDDWTHNGTDCLGIH